MSGPPASPPFGSRVAFTTGGGWTRRSIVPSARRSARRAAFWGSAERHGWCGWTPPDWVVAPPRSSLGLSPPWAATFSRFLAHFQPAHRQPGGWLGRPVADIARWPRQRAAHLLLAKPPHESPPPGSATGRELMGRLAARHWLGREGRQPSLDARRCSSQRPDPYLSDRASKSRCRAAAGHAPPHHGMLRLLRPAHLDTTAPAWCAGELAAIGRP